MLDLLLLLSSLTSFTLTNVSEVSPDLKTLGRGQTCNQVCFRKDVTNESDAPDDLLHRNESAHANLLVSSSVSGHGVQVQSMKTALETLKQRIVVQDRAWRKKHECGGASSENGDADGSGDSDDSGDSDEGSDESDSEEE